MRHPIEHPTHIQASMTLPTRPHAIFSTLQGTQNPDTKPTLQRAKNADAQPTAPRLTNINHHKFNTSAIYHYSTTKPTHHPTQYANQTDK
jgi:glutaredoxin 2